MNKMNICLVGVDKKKRGPPALSPWPPGGGLVVCLLIICLYIPRSPSVTPDFSRAPSVAKNMF